MAKQTIRMRDKYQDEVVSALQEKFQFKSSMQVPRPIKVVVNMGMGRAVQNPKSLESAISDLEIITGQKAVKTRAKKSI